jgi:hypothetical protein
VPKEQGHAARSKVRKYRQPEEWGYREKRDREQQEDQFHQHEKDRHGRLAKEQQGERCGSGTVGHLARGEAGFFHADDKGRSDPEGGTPQGRQHRSDGRQAQDRRKPVHQRPEDRRARRAQDPLKKFAASPSVGGTNVTSAHCERRKERSMS